MPQPHSAKEVAKFFLTLAEPDEGDAVTNLKLQKLCYYAQGFSLATLDRPMFGEAIEAWEHGPVVPDVYHEYKRFGSERIPEPKDVDLNVFSPEERELLVEVWNVYGQFSAWKLRNMTHDEPPWKDTERGDVISHEKLRAFFRTLTS